MEFFDALASQTMLETIDAVSPSRPHRERLYPPTVALSMFMQQARDAATGRARRWLTAGRCSARSVG